MNEERDTSESRETPEGTYDCSLSVGFCPVLIKWWLLTACVLFLYRRNITCLAVGTIATVYGVTAVFSWFPTHLAFPSHRSTFTTPKRYHAHAGRSLR